MVRGSERTPRGARRQVPCPLPTTARDLLSTGMIEPISRSRLLELLRAGGTRRVAVIGDAMLDVYLRGEVTRISPEAPVPVVRVTERKLALGGAANVAQNVLAIGAECELVCAVGSDREGDQLRKMLKE